MTERDTSRDVAIIGVACRFAAANDHDRFWANLVEGRQCFGPIPADRWDHDAFLSERFREKDKTYVTRGAFIDDVDSFGAMHFGIAPRRVEVMDPQHRMVLETTRVALLDAGIEANRADLATMGTFIGVSTSEYRNLVTSRTMAMLMATGQTGGQASVGEALSRSVENVSPISAFSMPGVLMNMAAANVANHWQLGGPAYTVDAACASSLLAVHDAVTHIRAGICNTALAGGVYVNLTPEAIIGFSRIGAISQKGDCRPFDRDADGFLQGDGCGVVVLKRLDDAVADRDRIYAVICGSGVNNDAGQSSGPMAPSLDGQKGAIRAAIRDASVESHSIGFVSCHGTATPVGDPVEVGALRDVLTEDGDLAQPVQLGSVKGNFGHTMSAAGVAGLLHAVLALHHEKITPQAGYALPHPELNLGDGIVEVPTELLPWKRGATPRRAGVSAFGFGGTNVHLVLEEAPFVEPVADTSRPHAVVLRADDRALLADYAEAVASQAETIDASFASIAYTLSATRRAGRARLAVVASDATELAATLRRVAPMLRADEAPSPMLGPDAFFGEGAEGEAPGIAFMFPGQGAQRLGLFRELADRYPTFAAHLDRLSAAAEEIVGAPIRDLLYPATEDDEALARLTATEVCQPAMAAIGLALAAFLRELGVEPDVCLGHSLGEFAAAAAGGMLTDEEAVRFVARRGRLMADLDVEDFGAMAAVMAAPDAVTPHLAEGAQLANLNHPQQTVISGTTPAIEATTSALEALDIKVTQLRVSHAFHSPVVDRVKPALAAVVGALHLAEPTIRVVSAITGAAYGGTVQTRETFGAHTTATVDFMAALREASSTASIFVEVGAGGALCSFANGTLGDELYATRSLGSRGADDGREFQRGLALLAASGVDVAFEKLHPVRTVTSIVAAPLARTRHWVIRDKPVALDVPESSLGGEIVSNDSPTNGSNHDLVALFREQNEILRQHADIIAAQTAVLGGGPVTTIAPAAPNVAQTPVPAVEPEAPVVTQTDFGDVVREAVASVSAFPIDALSDDQQLARDLGFDSLMFVDLASDLQKRVPGLEIPQAAFDQSTAIGDVIAFVTDHAGQPTSDSADEPVVLGEVRRFRVDWKPVRVFDIAGTPFEPAGSVAITTSGADDEAMVLARTLEERGVTTRIVDLDDHDEIGEATVLIHLANRRHAWAVSHLETLRRLAAQLHANGAEALVTVTSTGADAATRGALRGFAKALGREWPDARCVGAHIDDDVAAHLLRELDDARHYPEVRWVKGVRYAPVLAPAEATGTDGIKDDDVVVVTGGARGIARQCVEALARQTKAKFVLVGRSAHADLGGLEGRAKYLSWDVATPKADAFGDLKPTVVVHAAGVIRDAAVQDKSSDDVRLVTGVKVDGLHHVLAAAGDSVRTVVGFGSWAGRFGNAHQCDYAAANDAMSEVLTELAAKRDVRAVNLDWPVWDDSVMGDSIPASLKEAMVARGVTFLTAQEGVDLFCAELGATDSGEVLYGRTVPGREARVDSALEASLEKMPYVADHVVRGAPIVPLAGALDMLAAASAAATDARTLTLRDVTLFKGLDLTTPSQLRVHAQAERGRGTAEIHVDGELAYRAKFDAATQTELKPLLPELLGDAVTPKLDLAHFYADVAFHGPRIQGITKVEGIAPEWVVGLVKTSTPADLGVSDRDRWQVDPLVIDAAMQLVLYHLQSLHGFGAIPVGIDEYVQVRPFEGAWVRCSMALDEMRDGNIVGTISFEDEKGLAAVMTRLRAKEFHDDERPSAPADIDPKHWDISKWTEVEELEQRLQMADLIGIRNPYFWTHDGPARNTAMIDGREMINYSSYNYCGFSGHPGVSKAAQDAVAHYGTSVSASRIASGQIPLHQELEDAISDFVGTEATLVFAAGHMTNETVIGHVFGKRDLIIHDALAHNSILTGAELSGAKRMSFPHSDWEALDRTLTKLRGNFEKVGIFIEGVYSMDGDIPNLPKFLEVKNKHRALLYVDEAHSIGVIGPRGAGISDYYGIDPMEVDIWMGTLSKSFASCGGFITGSSQLIQYLKYTTPAFVFSAGISPANAAAANAACRLLAQSPEIPHTLQARAALFVELCQKHGIDTGMSKDSAVVPAIVGNSIECLKLSGRLAERGINVQPIVYPAVDDDASRLRFFLSAVHTEENLRQTVEILAEELANVRSGAAAE